MASDSVFAVMLYNNNFKKIYGQFHPHGIACRAASYDGDIVGSNYYEGVGKPCNIDDNGEYSLNLIAFGDVFAGSHSIHIEHWNNITKEVDEKVSSQPFAIK